VSRLYLRYLLMTLQAGSPFRCGHANDGGRARQPFRPRGPRRLQTHGNGALFGMLGQFLPGAWRSP